MADKPTALRLADLLEAGFGDCGAEAAAELRRLHDVEKAYKSACDIISEQDKKLAELEAVNRELLEALLRIATVNAMDYEYQAWARAAIAKAEGQK